MAKQLSDKGMTVYSTLNPGDATVVSFTHPTIHPEDFARLLDAQGIAVRTWTPLCSAFDGEVGR